MNSELEKALDEGVVIDIYDIGLHYARRAGLLAPRGFTKKEREEFDRNLDQNGPDKLKAKQYYEDLERDYNE